MSEYVPGPATRATIDQERPVLSVRNLRKVYGTQVAVDDMNFDLMPGRSLAIVGESGSGKTTVARMITGLEKPTSGTITACGRDRSKPARRGKERKARGREVQIVFQDPYSSLDPRQSGAELIDEVLRVHHDHDVQERKLRGREVQIVFQDPYSSLDPRQSGADLIDEVLRVHHDHDASDRKRIVGELAEIVGLDQRQINAMPKALSGGQRQRVAIARALATDPRVLILDESVAALDVSIQAQVLNVLADIRDERGISYVLISHDLAVVRQLTEDAIVMQRGIVVEQGRTGDILDNPQHAYTQMLRASVPGPGWKPQRMRERLLGPATAAE